MSDEKGTQLLRHFVSDRTTEPRVPSINRGLCTGIVVGTLLPNNLVTVRLDDHDRDITCVWAAGILSGLLGLKTSYIPALKSRVIVFYTCEDISFILGEVPQHNLDVSFHRAVTNPDMTPYGSSKTHTSRKKGPTRMMNGHNMPIDLVEGELDLSNLMGVGISLLRNLATLQAGDLARVECHLMDDMVRVISGTFKHHSCIGDHRIYNDGGKLNMEWHGSSYDFEAYGNLNPEQHRVQMDDINTPNLSDKSQIDGFKDEGRWRLSQYVGWIGDFVNIFITDPVNALGRLASDQLRSGKFRCHVNEDGTFLVQSVSELALEKVVRIPVPVRIRREDDPEGNRTDTSIGSTEHLKNWKPSAGKNNLFEMAFQLREYARWLNSTWSLARFRQLSLDFRVPTEKETPAPDANSDDKDKENINGEVSNWREVYATIRILRDGSCMMVDGYGNSMLTTKLGVQISSTKDLLLEAAGSVNIIAGRDINLTAQKNINLAAIKEALRLKAHTGLQMLVSLGNIVMDFLDPLTHVLKINSKVNINNLVEITTDGTIKAMGDIQAGRNVSAVLDVTGFRMAAMLTAAMDGHQGHIFPSVPIPPVITPVPPLPPGNSSFSFQTNYGYLEYFQTYTQSSLERLEFASSTVDWYFGENVIPGKGAPWPGEFGVYQKTVAGANLNQPSPIAQGETPEPMMPMPILTEKMKVQI